MGTLFAVGLAMCTAHVVICLILRHLRILRDTPARGVLGFFFGAVLGVLQGVALIELIPGGSELSNLGEGLLAMGLAVVCFLSAVIAMTLGFIGKRAP